MSISPDDLIDALLAQGVSLDALMDAASRRAQQDPTRPDPPDGPGGADPVTLPGSAVSPLADEEVLPARYRSEGLLGSGGMGSVRRVHDQALGRRVALKTLHELALRRPGLVRRFYDEAIVTAQLQHPGVIPVYDMGSLQNGQLWFTMKEVRGRTLKALLREVHGVSQIRWQSTADGWGLRRLVGLLHRVCETLAYAHERGVVHRDLKPSNIMAGSHGEVFVLDWGIAKVLDRTSAAGDGIHPGAPMPEVQAGAAHTQVGFVAGTPAYIAPEQVAGRRGALGPRTDVYALGCILYEILSGHPPYRGRDSADVLGQVLAGPPPPLAARESLETTLSKSLDDLGAAAPGPRRPLPPALVAAAERAMERVPENRFENAHSLAAALESWLNGTERREEALRIVETARKRLPKALVLRTRAALERQQSQAALAAIEPWRPAADKASAWRQQARADGLFAEAERLELETDLLLHAALNRSPELPEAHALLSSRYRARHAAAEAAGEDTLRLEGVLRRHVLSLSAEHPERPGHVAYLQGDGCLSLLTEPPGVAVTLYRYTEQDRRLVPTQPRALGATPLHRVGLPMGSYLCQLTHPDGTTTPYPVYLRRGEHWDGVAPGRTEPGPVRVPSGGEFGGGERLVLGGWFVAGGRRSGPAGPPVRMWADDFFVRTHPVTNAEFVEFLNDLVAQGRAEEALRHAPRTSPGAVGVPGALLVGFEDDRFFLRADTEGDLWEPSWPVVFVDWHGAQAFARWEAIRTGLPWRLLTEVEWEKAARGVDGRVYPMGPHLDPSWARLGSSAPGRPLPAPVEAYPDDLSPYGVRGCAGNCADWCADRWDPEPLAARPGAPGGAAPDPALADSVPEARHQRALRGGNWSTSRLLGAQVASRSFAMAHDRWNFVGFRLGRSR